MIALLVWLGSARAGLIDAMDDQTRHLAYCQQAAEDATDANDYAQARGVWEACLSEADRLHYEALLPGLRAQVSVSKALESAAPLREKDPHHWALEVLQAASAWARVEMPTDVVRSTFKTWMETDEGRAYVEDIRTVSVSWEGKPGDRVNELLRKSVEDAGLKWADPGDASADTVINARLEQSVGQGQSNAEGTLRRVSENLVIKRIWIRRRKEAPRGFSAAASAEGAELDPTTDTALRNVCDATALRLLQRLLEVVLPE